VRTDSHINLFEAEEKVERARLMEHERRRMQEGGAPVAGAPQPPPSSQEGGRVRGPFYLQESPYNSTSATVQQRSEAFVAREARRKAELDPMASYNTTEKRRRTDDIDAGTSQGAPLTSTALVVRFRANGQEKTGCCEEDEDDVFSTSSESSRGKRRRKKEKKQKRKKKHRRSSEERERRPRTSEKT
jgi:hypothetical protein